MEAFITFAYIILAIGIINLIEYYSLKKRGKFTILFFNNYLIRLFNKTSFGRFIFNTESLKRMTLRAGIAAIILSLWILYNYR